MRFAIGRAEARVHFGVLLLFAWCAVIGEMPSLLLSVLSLLVHECAHAIAAKNMGRRVTRVSVYPFGAVMTLDDAPGSHGEWTVAAAGPIASLAVSGMLKLSSVLIGETAWCGRLARINLLIALLNLLPAYPLDGGRIFRAILKRTASERTARCVLLLFTGAIGSALFGAGIFLILRGVPAWTLLALPPFLIASAFSEWKRWDGGVAADVLMRSEALKNGFFERAETVVLSEDATVRAAMHALSARRFTILRILRGSRFYELDEGMILKAAAKYGPDTPLKIVISRLTLP